jgi:glycosyltransferase involved in cell wall biosynthesis
MNPSEILISVALVTRNRPKSLERCLKSLRSQDFQPFEVIVSDDSDPEIAPEVKAIAKHWDCRYITGPCRGLYANRNHAALACRGTHIRTMDDDHEFPEGHFREVEMIVKSNPDSIWIFGEYHEKPNASSKLHLPGEIQPRGFSNLPNDLDNCFALSDGACVYPKEIFKNHCYLETFKFGYLYLEFGARLKALGYHISCCKNTYIIHHLVPGQRSFNDQNMQRKSAFMASYLTYSCYHHSILKKLKCLGYFLLISLATQLDIKNYYINLRDVFQVWKICRKYKKYFSSGQYSLLI